MRAYIALLACSMKVLNAAEANLDHELFGASDTSTTRSAAEQLSLPWDKLPGAVSWDFATGSVGNTVNKALINQLGSRTLAILQESGAELSKIKSPA